MRRKAKKAAGTKTIKKKKKWKLIKKQPVVKKKKDLDDELEIIPELEDSISENTIVDDVDINDEVSDVETVNTADSLESMEDAETFSLGGNEDDGRLETIRANPKPKPGWSDKVEPTFSPGDLVVPIELSKKDALEFEPYKIVCPHVYFESYCIKKSRILAESIIYSDEVKLAPKNGKPFVTHWEANDPFKVPGIKISCPSNDKK